MSSPTPATRPPRRRRAVVIQILGAAIALLAVGLCVRTLVDQWPTVQATIVGANPWLLAAAVACGVGGAFVLALQWWLALRVFGARAGLGASTSWYFAGELGKYLPGGIWQAVGRGELARRSGLAGSSTYAASVICVGLTCVASAFACVLLAPFTVGGDGGPGEWLWILALIPIGLVMAHPAILGALLRLLARMTGGRVTLVAPPWRTMIGLILVPVPTWLLIGAAAVLTTDALGVPQEPARVALAAIVAWMAGVLAVPVPAGAGIRELVFVALAGLPVGPALACAAVSRLMFVAIDLVGGVSALIVIRRRSGRVAMAGGPEAPAVAGPPTPISSAGGAGTAG